MSESRAVLFDSEEALLAALTSRLVPAKIRDAGVRWFRGDDGAIGVVPYKRLPRATLAELTSAGAVLTRPPERLAEAPCWPAVIAPRRARDDVPERTPLVLLIARGERSLLDLAGELIRLGCDRLAYQLVQPRGGEPVALIRAFEPPYYTLARAGEDGASCTAFAPMPSGQTRTWIELGFEHPLAGAVAPPADRISAIRGDGAWQTFPDGPWRDVFDLVDFALPGEVHAFAPRQPERRLAVPLRLAPAHRDLAPTLWVLRGDAIARVEALVRTVPDDVIARLSFAVLGDPRSGAGAVVLRARSGRAGPPALDFGDLGDTGGIGGAGGDDGARRRTGGAFAPYLAIPNLYVPVGSAVEPPLRRDSLRGLLAPDTDHLTWLSPTPGGGFTVERAPLDAFAPLADWVDYVIDADADALAPWVRSTTFAFASFRSTGREWADAGPDDARARGDRDRPPRQAVLVDDQAGAPAVQIAEAAAITPKSTVSATRTRRRRSSPPERPSRRTDELRQALARLERQFLDLDAPADDSQRIPLWIAMGQHHAALDNSRDAALCFVRALWERQGERALRVVDTWSRSDPPPRGTRGLWHPARSSPSPTAANVRSAVVHWIRSLLPHVISPPDPDRTFDTELERELLDVQAWLDEHDGSLDVRSVWLIRVAIAQVVGGDPLGLARVRDRILRALRDGLSLERDVPTFLRFLGGGAGDATAVAQLAESLEDVVLHCERTERQRSAIEGPAHLTDAYTDLVFAWGFARLGRTERASELRLRGEQRIAGELADPVHAFLVRAYAARIDQALAGERMLAALPPDVAAMRDGLGRTDRYKVDQLRRASEILEPQERLNPFETFARGESDTHGEVFAALREREGEALASGVEELLARAVSHAHDPDHRARMLDRLMDFFPLLHESQATRHLRTAVAAMRSLPPAARALLLEEALMLAGFFGASSLAGELMRQLRDVVGDLTEREAATLAREFASHLRNLRRVGLTDEATELLDSLSSRIAGAGPPGGLAAMSALEARLRVTHEPDVRTRLMEPYGEALEARLYLAAGFGFLGEFSHAEPILDEAGAALARGLVPKHLRDRLLRAHAHAWGQAPHAHALRGLRQLADQFATVNDDKMTNSHFCLAVISFVEAIVLGYVGSDLVLGETGRRWLDDDEYLVRRRIHREFVALTMFETGAPE